MAQGIAGTIKLGRMGHELDLTPANGFRVAKFSYQPERLIAEADNILGETFERTMRMSKGSWKLSLPHCTNAARDAILGMYAIGYSALSFTFADDWQTDSIRAVVYDTVTGIYLPTTPYLLHDKRASDLSLTASLSIRGAFQTYSAMGLQTTTNFFSTATGFNRQTWFVPFNTTTVATGTEIFVNVAYDAALVRMQKPSCEPDDTWDGTGRRWNLAISLKGV